jgi:hypothetical protein
MYKTRRDKEFWFTLHYKLLRQRGKDSGTICSDFDFFEVCVISNVHDKGEPKNLNLRIILQFVGMDVRGAPLRFRSCGSVNCA